MSANSADRADENGPDYFGFERPEIAARVPTHARRLLDVGCGKGLFGKRLKEQRPLEVWGAEINPEAAAVAATHLDRVIAGPFEDTPDWPSGHFDVITFNDSLEHFPETEPPLRLARRLLAPGGVVICSLPNVRYYKHLKQLLVQRDWEYVDAGILDRTHLRFFTAKSMRRTFEQCGFEVLSLEGINPCRWRSPGKLFLSLFLGPWVNDMKYLQFVSVLRDPAPPGGGEPAP